MAFSKYESYKSAGVEWLEEIPSHWNLRRLKHIAKVRLSNVDKHSRANESPVRLCNYTDVYYQSHITEDIDFMVATATDDQIKNFKLERGDVLITKDSESPDDIAVPAYVPQSFEDVICGYHLAHIKPIQIDGSYLFRAFQAENISSQFRVSANGITRYGISKSAISDAFFPIPPVEEQHRITSFLDRKTSEINQAIAQKQRLIELLQEQKAILINQAVTKGLNPNAPMRDSGVEWIGNIPAHWSVVRNRYLFYEQNERSTDGSEVHLSMSQKFGLIPSDELAEKTLQSESYEGAKLCKKGDLVLNRLKAHLGVFSVAPCDGLVSPDYSVFRIRYPKMIPEYFENLFKTSQYISEFNKRVKGIVVGFYRLYTDAFYDISCIYPPEGEQAEIRSWLSKTQHEFKIAENTINHEIEKLTELKTVFISNAVTGKLKV